MMIKEIVSFLKCVNIMVLETNVLIFLRDAC